MPQRAEKIEISHRTIIFAVFFVLFLWLLYVIRDTILQFFVALLIMAILNPLVTKLSKYKIPRSLSILLVYVLLVGLMSFVVATVIPPLIEQTTLFINNFPSFLDNLGVSSLISEQVIQQLLVQIGSLPAQAAKITLSLFSNVINIVTILVFAFYLLASRSKLDDQLVVFLGETKNNQINRVIDLLEKRLGSWAIGQMSLMFVVGLSNYIGLRLLGIPFALPLAILAGILEIVPFLGPIIASVPAVVIGFGLSPFLGLATAALAFLIQQLENYVFVPKIMQKSTGINPIITLLSLAIGFKLAGVVGLLISVPIFISASIISKEYLLLKK
ncbi:hypothetical protein A2955_02500 [Candidatus Woesebacteria bacterium RIFCSPLOWO2_01_FULL_37_19]|uniref:AI-2E family transporter n=2 Tax=Candidatus Woeseibacteriota TaxID=1752722 RepID=A0A1F8B7T6_9BACT|nr:MAG: hypothetical protein A2771_01300 [Candidatus Woesebacteria bacterium RIFCSPHIGHO2_01_FULL_38_26b]OGM59418.1 MAG: hypothetical protein A2955_02500 [Candidatus Woesebacteria bacterium RIFCSPLOWO2_01_FULL_37_19]